MFYDEELPNGFQDADFEMRELEEMGNAIARAEAAGICTHQSAVGYRAEIIYPEQVGLTPGQLRCTSGCGEVFEDDEDWDDARHSAIGY